MAQERKSNVGDPIWVESLMTREEWKTRYRTGFPSSTVSEPVEYDPNYHKDGKWRNKMGSGYTQDEINKLHKGIDELRAFTQKKTEAEYAIK